jgi:hypothetical protein
MKSSRIILAFPFVLLAACGSSKGSGIVTETMHTDPADAGDHEAAADSAPPVPPKQDAAPPPPAPTGECGAEATQTGCVTCCQNKHEDGATTYGVALIECSCLEANCAKECLPTICDENNPKNPDAACNTCMAAKSAACSGAIKTACNADPDCIKFDACVGESSCTSKSN